MALMFEVKDGVTRIVYNVRVVFNQDRYGRDGTLINDGEPLVEFYDSRYPSRYDHNGDLGQFASRYYISTLLKDAADEYRGLCLHGGVKDWNLCNTTFQEVRRKLNAISKVFSN